MNNQAPLLEQGPRSYPSRIVATFRERLFPSHYTDELTGLGNTRSFELEVDKNIARNPGEFAELVIDVDDLKQTNDTQGHAAGDTLIIKTGATLAAEVVEANLRNKERRTRVKDPRPVDGVYPIDRREISDDHGVKNYGRIFRFHGDELGAVLVGITNEADLATVIDRLNNALKENEISASIGGAVHVDGMSSTMLFSIADQKMYEVKKRRKAAKIAAEIASLPLYRRAAHVGATILTRIAGLSHSDR